MTKMLIGTSQGNFWQIILSEKHAPLLKQITKTEGKTKSKPQIRTGILTSIQNKKENIQQILQSERPGTKRYTTTVQKLQKYSFKFDKKRGELS